MEARLHFQSLISRAMISPVFAWLADSDPQLEILRSLTALRKVCLDLEIDSCGDILKGMSKKLQRECAEVLEFWRIPVVLTGNAAAVVIPAVESESAGTRPRHLHSMFDPSLRHPFRHLPRRKHPPLPPLFQLQPLFRLPPLHPKTPPSKIPRTLR
eukprot:TRINITY_DN6932_c0_g1_i1.p1 TRINITY_DN6932_c0_g1~~TRINITY_DN6932_c0_g1_i1.p1  ORF type:complete len:156 (+),score=17.97 TRINITY_DN6932_c0_g1_i1:586-1053(+)